MPARLRIGFVNVCVFMLRSIGDDIRFFVCIEEPGDAVDQAVGELGCDSSFGDVGSHKSARIRELDTDSFFKDGIVGEPRVGFVHSHNTRARAIPDILIAWLMEGVFGEFKDDQPFDPEHLGDFASGQGDPLGRVVEYGEQVCAWDGVGGVGVLDEPVVDPHGKSGGDAWVVGFDESIGADDDGERMATDSGVLGLDLMLAGAMCRFGHATDGGADDAPGELRTDQQRAYGEDDSVCDASSIHWGVYHVVIL